MDSQHTFRNTALAKPMLVAGIMSGTSADGIDIALCRISVPPNTLSSRPKSSRPGSPPSGPGSVGWRSEDAAENAGSPASSLAGVQRPAAKPTRAQISSPTAHESLTPRLKPGAPFMAQLFRNMGEVAAPPRLKLLAHRGFPYPAAIRSAVLAAMDAKRTSTAELSRLHWRLGHIYADALQQTLAATQFKPALIALHGQTIYHQATAQPFLGQPTRATWQIGEPSVLAERLKIPVVSDFRPADLAAGGQGAPLVPMLDFCLFRHATRNRLLLNLGGIANVTALPAACTLPGVLAFDTGPANMVIDACMQKLYNRSFDRDGVIAARGRVLEPIVKKLLTAPFFSAPPPKSCGREQFDAAFTARFLALCERHHARKQDIIATATALTAQSILEAYRRFCWPHLGQRAPSARATELFAAGGGAKNPTLMRLLTEGFAPLGVKVSTTASTTNALPVDAKEAAAFALLGWLTWHNLPGNVPSATGASRPVILGTITLA